MARKLSLSDLTSDGRRPAWAEQLRQTNLRNRERDKNALSQARAAADAIAEAEGVVLPESQIKQMAQQIKETGDFSLDLKPSPPADFSDVTSESDTTAGEGLLGRLSQYGSAAIDAVQGSLQSALAANKFRTQEQANTMVDDLRAAGALGSYNENIEAERARQRESLAETDRAAKANEVNVQRARDLLAGQGALEKWTAQAVLDASSSPLSALSLVGGPTALIGIEDVSNKEYRRAREAGLSEDEAKAWSISQTAPELISLVPAGKVFGKTPVAKKAVGGLVERLISPGMAAAMKVSRTAAGEAVEEMATGTLQDIAAAAIGGMSHQQELSKFADAQVPKTPEEFMEKRAREGAAALVFGGAAAPITVAQSRAEFNQKVDQRTEDTTQAALENVQKGTQAVPRRTARTEPAQGDLFPDTVQEQAAPEVTQTEEATTADASAKDARSVGGQYKLPLNKPRQPKAVEAAPVQTRGRDKYYTATGDVGSNRRDTAVREAERAIDLQDKADAKAAADKLKKAQDKHKASRVKELERLTAASRELPRTDRASFIADQIMNWDTANPTPSADAVAAPVEEKVVTPTPEKPAAPPAKPGTVDATLQDISNKLALGMKDQVKQTATDDTPVFDPEQYKTKIRDVVKDLAQDNTQKSVDAINLINQGKLILAPTPEAIGRQATEDVAQFEPGEGKMYLYTDRLNKGDTLGAVIRTYHEATHAGQFNDRQGRPAVMQQIMGKGPAAKAQATIIRAADGGNAIAKRAVDKAREAAGGNQAVEDLEILPYFVGEVVESRGSTLGQLRGVANDVLASARQFVRKATGKEFDVSMRDLEKAVSGVGQEIVQTDLKPAEGDTASMIYGETATGFKKAQEEGRVYNSKDGRRKFVLSDADAKLKPGAEELLQRTGSDQTVAYALKDVLDHPVLFENMPEAEDVQIAVNPNMPRRTFGQYWPGRNLIEINPNRLYSKEDDEGTLREIIIHEVQHWAQEKDGGNEVFATGEPQPEWERKAVQDHQKAKMANDDAAEQLLYTAGRIATAMPSATAKAAIRSIVNNKSLSSFQKANAIANQVKELDVEIEDLGAAASLNNFDYTLSKYRQSADKYNEAMLNKHRRYVSKPTEAEAFFTQRNIDTKQEDLPVNPEVEDQDFATPRGADMGLMALNRGLRKAPVRAESDPASPAGWSSTLGMANPNKVNPITTRWAPTWMTGLFKADKGLSRVDNEVIEHAIASPAGYRMKAEAEMGKYDYAVAKLAAQQGKSKEALNKEIQAVIDGLPKDLKTHAENVAAFDAAVSPYGEAGKALKAMRDQVDELTMSILQQRADSGIPLTEADKKLYKTLVENMGKYTHRQYAAHAGKLGNKYANAVMKDYEKYKAGKGRGNPTIEANYRKVADATKYLIDNNLLIPDDETLANLGADQTRNLYNTWGSVGNPDGLTLDQMKEELADSRDRVNSDKDALNTTAEVLAKELLGLAPVNSPITTYYRGGKQDTSILQRREAIPPSIRSLMGEIVDPSMRMIMTVAKQAEFVGRNKMLLELANSNSGDILPPGAVRPEGWTKLQGEGYGPLQGFIVSPNMQAAIGDVQQQLATFEQAVAMSTRNPRELGTLATNKILDLWSIAAGTSKMLQVIWSPMNFIYNFVGGPFTLLINGNVNPVNFAKGLSSARDLISYAINPKAATDAATRLVANDVVDSAFVGEIKNEQYRELRKVVMEMAGRRNPTLETLGEILHKAKAGFKETYAMMDVLYKIANFYQQVDTLTDFYKKNGDVRTAEQIDREAADIAKRTNFTYRRVAPVLKAIESKGFSAFGPYMHEVFRTQIAGVFQGIGEIQRAGQAKTPEARNVMLLQGTKRLTGIATAWGLLGAASSLLSGITFGEDDDENEAKRALLPEYLRDQDFVEIGKDKNGKPVLFNVSRFDPIGPATDLMRGILQGGIDPEQLSKKLLDLYVTPRIGPQLVTAVGTTLDPKVKVNRVPLVQELAPEQYSTLLDLAKQAGVPARVAKAWTNVAETLYPGIATAWRSTNARPVSPDNATTSAYNAATYLGMQLQALDPAKPVKFSALDYADSIKQGRSELVEMFKDNPNRTQQEVLSQLLDSRENERESFDQIRKVYEGAAAVGTSPRELQALLKQAKLNKAQIASIADGDFASSIISKKSLKEYEKKELQEKPRSEHKQVKLKWDNIRDLLEATSRQMETEEET